MQVTETLSEGLKREIKIVVPAKDMESRMNERLIDAKDKVRLNGFRPGKVPMNVVAQRYGYSVQYEVVNDKLGAAFNNAANEAQLRVAGLPRIEQKNEAPEGQMAFDATFEVYPEVKIGDLAAAEVERVTSDVTEEAIDKTVEILRKQRRSFAQRA
ncbi:MAG: trigger factor, partial [Gammaproteobacteria bacterium]|nr:trigger factor [Gammaproteobacteria bacterium]